MNKKVAIMGFGRIGKDILRIASLEDVNFDITHIAVRSIEKFDAYAQLFQFDSIYRRFPKSFEKRDKEFIVDGKSIKFIQAKSPDEVNWEELGVDIVIDSTGAFKEREKAELYLKAGAKKVIITAPAKNEDLTVVMGVNDDLYDSKKHNIISNASCTTNCLAPITKVILEEFGIVKGLMTTVHAYTNDQRIHDSWHKDLRRARMGAENIIPTSTGAAKAVGKVIPEVDGLLTGFAMRVPVPTGSIVDVTFELKKEATKEEINESVKKYAEGKMKGILEYSEDELVSSDIVQNPHSSIFDSKLTLVKGNMAKLISWYDNEWGYANRVVDLTKKVAEEL